MPSYQLKRTYQAGYMPPSKRRRTSKARLTRQLALRKPEVKDVIFSRAIAQLDNNSITSASLFSGILQGPSGSNRIGDRIRVLSITVSGRPFGDINNSTFALICPNRADRTPQLADFGPQTGTLYDLSNGWVLMHKLRDGASLQVLQEETVKFPMGMLVHYDQPSESEPDGAVSKNNVFATHVNRTGTNVTNINFCVRIRFVDA